MKRILQIWAILFLANLAARPAISYLGFNHVDARYEAFVQLVVLPFAETLVLAAVIGAITRRSLLSPLRRLRKDVILSLFLILDAIILLIVLMPGLPEWMRLTEANGFAGLYSALKAICAGILVVAGSFRMTGAGQRRWLMVFGVALAAYGVDHFAAWLAPLSAALFSSWPPLFQWLFFYGSLFALTIALAAKVESIWAADSPDAGFALRYAALLVALATIVVALSYFNRSFVPPPWNVIVKVLSFLTMTAIVAASWLAFRPCPADDKV
jgi:hypothetical protein